MRFTELHIAGAFVLDPDCRTDERGHFAHTYTREAFTRQGLNTDWAQCATAFNHRRGTLRGLHYQAEPHAETKLLHCSAGSIFDVLVDLRPDSPTLGRWVSVVLSAANRRVLYVPAGLAHGYQTLEDRTEVFYQISAEYHAELQRGIRWDDETLAIAWPECERRTISPRDRQFPRFADQVPCCQGGPLQ